MPEAGELVGSLASPGSTEVCRADGPVEGHGGESATCSLVERSFRELTDKNIRRCAFPSVPDLIASIDTSLRGDNEHPRMGCSRVMESTVGPYETELINRQLGTKIGTNLGRAEVENEPAKYVSWFNEERLHSSIGYLPPVEYERGH